MSVEEPQIANNQSRTSIKRLNDQSPAVKEVNEAELQIDQIEPMTQTINKEDEQLLNQSLSEMFQDTIHPKLDGSFQDSFLSAPLTEEV